MILLNKNLLKFGKHLIKYDLRRCLSIGLVGAPTSAGQCKSGVELAPNALRNEGLIEDLQRLGHNVIDFGDFDSMAVKDCKQYITLDKLKNELLIRQMSSQLISLVTNVVQNNRIPITLGGDHSIAIATISGNAISRPPDDMCVLWVDAHADINTVETTNTGNFHGMPVSFLLKEVQQILKNPNMDCLPINPLISAKNLGYIGLRDVEACEVEIMKKLNITYFTTQDIDKLGIHEVIARTLDKINPKLKKKIHVSFDIDAIDPILAPSTGTPVPGGLTLREALCIGEEIFATNMLCGLDLVEINPSIGNEMDVKATVNCGLNIILSFLGKQRLKHIYNSSEDNINLNLKGV